MKGKVPMKTILLHVENVFLKLMQSLLTWIVAVMVLMFFLLLFLLLQSIQMVLGSVP